MKGSPLLREYEARNLPLADYEGARSAAHWADEPAVDPWPGAGARLYDGAFRSALRLSGPEARKWLNGMISANVRDLAPGRVAFSFQLDPKGHILATLDVACDGPDSFWLLTSAEQAPALLERLRRFVFISKLTIEDYSERLAALIVRGPDAATALRQALEMAAPAAGGIAGLEMDEPGFVLACAGGGVPHIEIWAPPAALPELWQRLRSAAAPAGIESYERERILTGLPRYGVDITSAELPQETGQGQALDFTKGCYVGQEIVERIRARGAVHRQWRRVRFAAPVQAGAQLTAGGQAVGKVTSATRAGSDANGAWIALAYLRRPHDETGSEVMADAVAGTVLASGDESAGSAA